MGLHLSDIVQETFDRFHKVETPNYNTLTSKESDWKLDGMGTRVETVAETPFTLYILLTTYKVTFVILRCCGSLIYG